MGDRDGMEMLKQSGLNAAWFKRYEHMCNKYARGYNKHLGQANSSSKQAYNNRMSQCAKATISPLIEKNLEEVKARRRRRTHMSAKLPRIGGTETFPLGPGTHRTNMTGHFEDGRSSCPPSVKSSGTKSSKKPPKVQVRRGPDYVQPARLRTFEARLSCKVTAAADPYSAEVRKISEQTKMSAKRIEQLKTLFQNASKGRRTLDLPCFRKLMASLGQEDKSINDRLFEIYNVSAPDTFESMMNFPTFCSAILTFKTGSRADQAQLLFRIIDVSDDRNLSKFELLKFFCAPCKDKTKKRAMSAVVNELVHTIDMDGSGEVDRGEFVEKVSNDEDVWMMFAAISPFSEMTDRLTKFEFSDIDHSIPFDE